LHYSVQLPLFPTIIFYFIMLLVSLVFILPAVCAQNWVAGAGRLNSGSNQTVNFSYEVYSSTVKSIAASVEAGSDRNIAAVLPVDKIYGVNIGNWLVSEPWMSPTEWVNMGGQFCDGGDCSICRQSEWSLSNYLGQEKTNDVFKQHWQATLTSADVAGIVAAKLNTVRLPVGFWIIEDIVDRDLEPYAQGGLDELIRGLNMFKDAGINVMIDHHALPGVATPGQMFAGNCTDQVEFYSSPDDYNYKRAVTWAVVMTYLTHTHPAFQTVFSIEAVNEPIQDASKTPGLDRYDKAFVLGVRAIEYTLGITCDGSDPSGILSDSIALPAFKAALPIIAKLSAQYNIGAASNFNFTSVVDPSGTLSAGKLGDFLNNSCQKQCLTTQFMNRGWQHNNPPDPAAAADGPQLYDNHLYFNFGGVAPNATEDSYLQTICNATRIAATSAGNTPLYSGEWSLATAFNTTTDFMRKWADAQKLTAAQGAGWTFWVWRMNADALTYPILGQYLQWSYSAALSAGIFTADPSAYFDENVCAPYAEPTS
jgi:aryl-phospho-beta-D-glucosidase BglC (GH1 family)